MRTAPPGANILPKGRSPPCTCCAGGRGSSSTRPPIRTSCSISPATRTNVGFLETSGVPTTLRVTLLGVDGERLAERELLLAPLQAVQWNDVFAEMGAEPREEASAVVQVVEGGAAMAHAIRIDNRTNDASFVPGLVVRRPVAAPAGAR